MKKLSQPAVRGGSTEENESARGKKMGGAARQHEFRD
jgi:hypothetical protein